MSLVSRKRVYRDTLTGGTRDVNPQWFIMSHLQPANDSDTPDAITQTQFPIPIQRLSDRSLSQLMEVLKICYTIYPSDGVTVATSLKKTQLLMGVSTKPNPSTLTLATIPVDDPAHVDVLFNSGYIKETGGIELLPIEGVIDPDVPFEGTMEFDYSKCFGWIEPIQGN